jgi:hypothetical protein
MRRRWLPATRQQTPYQPGCCRAHRGTRRPPMVAAAVGVVVVAAAAVAEHHFCCSLALLTWWSVSEAFFGEWVCEGATARHQAL